MFTFFLLFSNKSGKFAWKIQFQLQKRILLKCAISGLQANILLKIRVLFHRKFYLWLFGNKTTAWDAKATARFSFKLTLIYILGMVSLQQFFCCLFSVEKVFSLHSFFYFIPFCCLGESVFYEKWKTNKKINY